MVTKDDFEAFLKRKRVLGKFIKYTNHSALRGYKYLFIQGDTKEDIESYVDSAFIWDETTEGSDYWYDLSEEWREYVSNHL